MRIRLLMTLAIAFAPMSLVAQVAEQESPWTGKASLGYLATSGNTENSSLNSAIEVGYASG